MFHTNLTIYFITHIFIDWFITLKNHNETICNHNILSVWSMGLRNKAHVSGITGACWWIHIIKMANICGSDSRYCSKKLTTFPESIGNFCILSLRTCRSSHWCLVTVSGFVKISVERLLLSSPLIWPQKPIKSRSLIKKHWRDLVELCPFAQRPALSPSLTGSFSEKKNHCPPWVIHTGKVHIRPTCWCSRSLNNKAGHISYCIGVISGIHF